MMTDCPCHLLSWDSRFFGCRIARLDADQLTASAVVRVLAWCRDQRIDCLYFLADADDWRSQQLAVAAGFRHVGVRLTLHRAATEQDDGAMPSGIRSCQTADIAVLAQIARRVYTGTRFYADARFDRARCARLYETWLLKSCRGLADAVWVADGGTGPAGYITCQRLNRETGEIGLLGVRPENQGQGLGRRLLSAALAWSTRGGLKRMRVVTQGDNQAAVRAYRQAGFAVAAEECWYHYWPATAESGSPRQPLAANLLNQAAGCES